MKVVVVGLGAIGSRHAHHLNRAGHQVLTVDCKRPADLPEVMCVKSPGAYASWIVATPTDTHLDVLASILRLDSSARILLEKPACTPTELPLLAELLSEHPRARVIVNDVYAHSPAARKLARALRTVSPRERAGRTGAIRGITIEFTKNRQKDVDEGRFVDEHYGDVGYEWFHMLSLLRTVLPESAYATYLRTAPQKVTDELRALTAAPGLPDIRLYASTNGRIGFPELAGFGYLSTKARRHIRESHIPYASDFRYRFIDVEFVSGNHITLVFEPYYGIATDYKNVHALHMRIGSTRRAFEIRGNHLEMSLTEQLAELVAPSVTDSTSRLRIPEHVHMAELAGLVRGGASSAHHEAPLNGWSFTHA
ncbi:hypothetical protein ACISU4_01200 [Streptomyces wuyuanensis]|uniref:hypothetical protein n=1 Tax=Streptomyces wuyuanensis TaxID=1196353 RepID=UPI0038259779